MGNPYAMYNLGLAYHKKSKYDIAIKYYEAAIEYIPHSLLISYNEIADCYCKIGNYDEEIKYYEISLTLFPTIKDGRNNFISTSKASWK